ncbi:MAG: DUF2842 domain-containing protein [Pseudomonadota bacterium]
MEPRTKKLIGAILALPLITLYVGAAAWLGSKVPQNVLLQAPYYLVAGVAWAFPLKHVVLWMNRPRDVS